MINRATHQPCDIHVIEKRHETYQLKEPHPPHLSSAHLITMLLIALYIIFGISLIRIVILSILLYHARICARLSHDIEMSIMRLANLILHHARTPAQLSHDLEMSRTRRSSLTHLSSLTEITEGEFNRLCRSRMWSQRLQNTCLSIYHACFTLHIGHQSSGHGHTRID